MIAAVCLNPCIDRTVSVERFVLGGTNRVVHEESHLAGKGVNCARILAALSDETCVIALVGRKDYPLAKKAVRSHGNTLHATLTNGSIRVNVKVYDKQREEITEINTSGNTVDSKNMAEVSEQIIEGAKKSRWLILSGSMPPGCPEDYYGKMIELVRSQAPECRIALDAEGEAFRLGVLARPDMVKPNARELSLFSGKPVLGINDAIEEASLLVNAGIATVIVSIGRKGSVLCTSGLKLSAASIPVQVKTTVGAGDAMVSGYVSAKCLGMDDASAFKFSVATATAEVAGDLRLIHHYLGLVKARKH